MVDHGVDIVFEAPPVSQAIGPVHGFEGDYGSSLRYIGFGLYSIATAIGGVGVAWLTLNFGLSWQIPTAIALATAITLLIAINVLEFEPLSLGGVSSKPSVEFAPSLFTQVFTEYRHTKSQEASSSLHGDAREIGDVSGLYVKTRRT